MGILEPISKGVNIGVDFGQRVDPTAICVCEVERRDYELNERERPKGGDYHYVVRYLERLPLGTLYHVVVDRLAEIYRKLTEDKIHARFWVDATGVGEAMVDLLDQAKLPVAPVYFVSGEKAVRQGREWHIGKLVLVTRLEILCQKERVHLPTKDAGLINELPDFERRISEAANLQYGAFRRGSHDDLCIALALSVWQEPKPAPAMAQREISIEDYRRASRGVARDRRPRRRR